MAVSYTHPRGGLVATPGGGGGLRIFRLSAPQAPTFFLRENTPLPPENALLLTPPSRTFFDHFLRFFDPKKKCKSRVHRPPPPTGGCPIPPLGYDPPTSPAKNREIRRVGVGGAQKI